MYSSFTIFFGHKVHSVATDKYRAATQHDRCAYEITQHMNSIGFTLGLLITACTLGFHTCTCLSSGGDHIYGDDE